MPPPTPIALRQTRNADARPAPAWPARWSRPHARDLPARARSSAAACSVGWRRRPHSAECSCLLRFLTKKTRQRLVFADALVNFAAAAHQATLRGRQAHARDLPDLFEVITIDVVQQKRPGAVLVHAFELPTHPLDGLPRCD